MFQNGTQHVQFRKTIYFVYAKLYVLYKVYNFATAKANTRAKHIVLYTYVKIYVILFYGKIPGNSIANIFP